MSDPSETPGLGAPWSAPAPRNGHERRTLRPEERTMVRTLAGGASVETLAGGAAAILAIIGLTGTRMFELASISAIVAGAALVALGAAIAMRWATIARRVDETFVGANLERGHQTELVAGAIGIVLGVLALFDVAGRVLLPIAVLVFSAALLRTGAAEPDVVHLARPGPQRPYGGSFVRTSADALVLAGIAGIVLGILACTPLGSWLTLCLVALLGAGASLFVAGGAVTGVFYRRLRAGRN